jgi:DASS family divalent anion:Na+ symporter
MDTKRALQIFIPAIIGLVIALMTPPEGLEKAAMIFMGIFVCAIFWLIFQVIDEHIVVIIAMTLFVVLSITDFKTAFAPFAGASVWLVIAAFGIAAVVGKTGLLKRISFKILSLFPENFKGQILAFLASGLVISPLIPSLTAKAAILAPFSSTAASSLGYEKGSNGSRGLFAAMWISSGIFGCAFLSGAIPVVTMLGFMPPETAAEFTWMKWFTSSVVWLVMLFVLTFAAIMLLCKPKQGEVGSVVEQGFAKKNLEALGPMSRDEKIAGILLALALLGWMTTKLHGIDTTSWALIILFFMAVFGLFNASMFKNLAWGTVFFVGGIFSLAAMISALNIHTWLGGIITPILGPLAASPYLLIPMICIAVYLVRTVVISQTATTALFYAALIGVCQSVGIHPFVLLFVTYMSTLVWHFSFTNVTYVAALGATGGDMVDHNDNQPMNIAFMVINLIACMASIPLWQMMGFIS